MESSLPLVKRILRRRLRDREGAHALLAMGSTSGDASCSSSSSMVGSAWMSTSGGHIAAVASSSSVSAPRDDSIPEISPDQLISDGFSLEGYQMVSTLTELRDAPKQKHRLAGGIAEVALFLCANGRVYAVENRCYHMGGPLSQGRITSVNDHPCVVCPWHDYIITLDTGEGMYQDIDESFKSKGKRQRVFDVKIDADGNVYVSCEEKTNFAEYAW